MGCFTPALRCASVARCALALVPNQCIDAPEVPSRMRVTVAKLLRAAKSSAGVRLWQLLARGVSTPRCRGAPVRLWQSMVVAATRARDAWYRSGAAQRTFAAATERRERRGLRDARVCTRLSLYCNNLVYYFTAASTCGTSCVALHAAGAVTARWRTRELRAARPQLAHACARRWRLVAH